MDDLGRVAAHVASRGHGDDATADGRQPISRRALIRGTGVGAVAIWASPLLTKVASAQVIGSPAPAACSPCVLCGLNLIVNPGADIGPNSHNASEVFTPTSWTLVQGDPTQFEYDTPASGAEPTATDPGPPAAQRGPALFAGGPNDPETTSILTQVVDLSSVAREIDGCPLSFTLSGWFGGFFDQNDRASLTAEFRNAALGTVGSATVGPVTDTQRGDATGLLFRTTSGTVPVGTRSVLLTLTFVTDIQSYNNGYADALSLVLTN